MINHPVGNQMQMAFIVGELVKLPYKDEDGKPIGYRVKVEKGKRDRSKEQNCLAWKWHVEAATQLKDGSANDKRAHCKLHFGVPILREDDEFRELYDKVVKPHDYETKIELMGMDFPVTSLMTVKQMTRYLDAIYQHF